MHVGDNAQIRTMAKYLYLIPFGLLISCSSTKTYQLSDSSADKDFLRKVINEYQRNGFNYKNPSLVVDGFLLKSSDVNSIKLLKFRKCQLKSIHFLNPTGAKNIYGQIGENGIVLIGTKKCDENLELEISDSLNYKGG